MSLSLSSLLNPSPDADANDQTTANAAPHRKDSLPPISYVQSPEQTHAPSLPATRQGYSYPAATEQDAIQGLAALAGSPPAPGSITSQWYQHGYDRRSSSYERRPGSSGTQLPLPNPDGRKMSSPTLDAYHVASRSPEQARAPSISGMTLPPLQKMTSSDETARAHAYEPATSLQQAPSEADARSVIASRDAGQELTRATAADLQAKPHSSAQAPMPDAMGSSPVAVKQETASTPPAPLPTEVSRIQTQQEMDIQPNKAVATLKTEHSAIVQSPLRESSVPVPSTEKVTPDAPNPKKRPAPAKKKGTATATSKKARPAKKRKVEPKRSATPTSATSKTPASKLVSSKGTPANSPPAPSTRSASAERDDEPYDDDEEMDDPDIDDNEMYCLCRKPDTGTFMIGCDGTCDDWFHGKCVGIDERDKNLIDKYMCPNCQKAGIGLTTWKRVCRRECCRMPARIGKSKGGKDGSKYCSDECGVRYFREMVAKTRGREDAARSRANRRKASIAEQERASIDDDLGARGGALAAGELKALITSSTSADDFKKLGEGVLSPPATPDSKKANAKDEILSEAEAVAVQDIARQKDEARQKHQLLKDRMKLVTMVKQAASRTAAERELKPKDYCGYDSRLEWSDAQFDRWRRSAVGKEAFELETLAVESSTVKEGMVEDGVEDMAFEVCERKKCARHLEWNKLAVDDVRAYMSDNGDRMRELDRAERDIRERAALRAKAGSLVGEGSVEVHAFEETVPDEGAVLGRNGEAREEIDASEKMGDRTVMPEEGQAPNGVAPAGETKLDLPDEQPAVIASMEENGDAAIADVADVAPPTPAVTVA